MHQEEREQVALLKSYLKRLGEGESLESVREDFVDNFREVDATEILKAEQTLLSEGTPLSEVQKLCDVHSALFHGMTSGEKRQDAQKASMLRDERAAKTNALIQIEGHPLQLFTKENEKLKKLIEKAKVALQDGAVDEKLFEEIRELSIHYAKKGDLLYPLLKVTYGISGPSDVMWTVDDEIRDEISYLAKTKTKDNQWEERFRAVLSRAEEMIYKETNILFPNCAFHFTEDEWIGIYHDQKDYPKCFGMKASCWDLAEEKKKSVQGTISEKEVVLPGGHMTIEQLTAILNTIPMEITFVDEENINRFFNEGPKDFKRPRMAIDREVFSCHPPKVEAQVKKIINEFCVGTLNEVPIWMEKNGKCMLVKYMAVRDRHYRYLGTLELVQDMDFAKNHFLPQKRPLGED